MIGIIITYAALLFFFGVLLAIGISAYRSTRDDFPAPEKTSGGESGGGVVPGGGGSGIAGWVKGVLVFFLLGFIKAILRNTPWYWQLGALSLTSLICLFFYIRSMREPIASIKLS